MNEMKKEPKNYYRTYAEIDLDAIRRNILEAKRCLEDKAGLIAVVKTNAYGHGDVAVANAVQDLVSGYAVAMMSEAEGLRKAGITKPILILGYVSPLEYEELIDNNIIMSVYSLNQAKELSEFALKKGKKALCHIKVDTGMNRIGFDAKDEESIEKSVDAIEAICGLEGIDVDGIFMHFATADEADKARANKQYDNFSKVLKMLEDREIKLKHKHCSNSAAIMDLPHFTLDWVRQGITLYGLFPSDEVNKKAQCIMPAMKLVSHVGHVKVVKPGWQISYGGTFTADKEMKVATVCAGYGDGYPRSLSNKGEVLIHGRRAKILGRVCMDQFMIDVTDICDVIPGDEVVLMGNQGEECIPAEELGAISGRFNYELVCDINPRVTRVYKLGGETFVI